MLLAVFFLARRMRHYFALITLNDFGGLAAAERQRRFTCGERLTQQQLQKSAGVYVRRRRTTRDILLDWCFFGLGSAVFAYLWFKSRLHPSMAGRVGNLRGVAGGNRHFGNSMVFPSMTDVVIPSSTSAPIFIFEVTLVAFGLLIKGIKAPLVE